MKPGVEVQLLVPLGQKVGDLGSLSLSLIPGGRPVGCFSFSSFRQKILEGLLREDGPFTPELEIGLREKRDDFSGRCGLFERVRVVNEGFITEKVSDRTLFTFLLGYPAGELSELLDGFFQPCPIPTPKQRSS